MTREIAYMLGFLAADGWISKNALGFALKRSDRKSVEYIASIIENITHSKISVVDYESRCGDKYYPASRFVYTNKEFKDALAYFGIVSSKSYLDIDFMQNIAKEFRKDFIYGYFDGDGSITLNEKESINVITITGRKLFLNKIVNETGYKWHISQVRKTDTYSITLQNKHDIKDFIVNYIELSRTVKVLDRKLDIAKRMLEYIEHKSSLEETKESTNLKCTICGAYIDRRSSICAKCYRSKLREHIPETDILRQELNDCNNNYDKLAEKYNVSSKTIVKWCKLRGIYKAKQNSYNKENNIVAMVLSTYLNTLSIGETSEILDLPSWKVTEILKDKFGDLYKEVLIVHRNNTLVMNSEGKCFRSAALAASAYGDKRNANHIANCIRGNRATALGFTWSNISIEQYTQYLSDEHIMCSEAIAYRKMKQILHSIS